MASTVETTRSRSHRLSKARTNTSYSNLLTLAEQQHELTLPPSSSSIYDSGDQFTVVSSAAREHRGRRAKRSKFRAYLHGASSEKSQPWSSDDEDEEQKGFTDLARGVRDRLSRVGTRPSISQSPSAGASTTQLSNCSSSYLDLTIEESTRVAEEIKEKAHMDRIAACNHVSSPIDEDLHVDAVQSPIRRKSLYTPGIATRTPNDILQKAPPPETPNSQLNRDYYFNPRKPESSPLAQLAALEIGEGGRSTPSELDYSHLGGLKPGTLRVTNGAATPVPRETSPAKSQVSSPVREEFFTASEGNESYDEAHLSSSGSPRNDKVYQRIGGSQAQQEKQFTNTSQERERTRNSKKSPQHGGSPLKYEHETDGVDTSTSLSRKAHSKWLERKHSLPAGFSFESPDKAMVIAYDYMKDLPDSPFSCAEISSISSSRTEHALTFDEGDKDSFEDEGVVISKSSHHEADLWSSLINEKETRIADNGTREDAFRRLNSNALSQRTSVNGLTSSTTTTRNADRKSSRLQANDTKTMSKADSGYSSSESLKSLNRVAPTNEHTNCLIPDRAQAPESKVLDCLPNSQKVSRPSLRLSKLIIPTALFAEPLPAVKISPLKEQVTASQPAADPSPRSRSRLRRLTKARRSSQPPSVDSIFVQGIRNLSQIEIPPVPPDVVMKHNERLRNFPLLQHTYPSLHHINSKDSMSAEVPALMSVQFPSPANSLKRAASICNTNLDWPSRRSARNEKNASRSRSSSKTRRKMDRQQSSQGETSATIADFGTIAECLGDSPYDIARSEMIYSRSANPSSFSQPHLMRISTPRAKSTVGLKEDRELGYFTSHQERKSQSCSRPTLQSHESFENRSDEIENSIQSRSNTIHSPNDQIESTIQQTEIRDQRFSRPLETFSERPDDRGRTLLRSSRPWSMFVEDPPIPALPKQDQHQRMQNFSKPFEPRRKSFDDRGGVPGRLLRPQNKLIDVPPMPHLPTKEQLEQKEAEIIRSNSTKLKTLLPPVQVKKFKNDSKGEISRNPETLDWEEDLVDLQENWEFHRKAWSQRRKSAGDALLLSNHAVKRVKPSIAADLSNVGSEMDDSLGKANLTISQNQTKLISNTRPALRPLSESLAEYKSTFSQPFRVSRKPLIVKTGNLEHDRYSGGLSYGYEPGFGLGGSAGTRNMKTGASRKSVDVSRGYGLDLSDVPIFVAPS